ncbi:MAG: glycoside hydrolase family 3 protein [Bacteroidales bacterium]|nr:glycoside hydrolase family 3 protein [Bacteroidales bacterium]
MKTLLLSLLLTLTACCNHSGPNHPGTPDSSDTRIAMAEDTLSLDAAIGQMLLIGFRGTEIDYDKNIEIVSALRDYHVGSVILFDYDVPTGTRGRNIKNPDQLKNLCRQLRSFNPDLLIGIDQEGGYVSRLARRYGFPAIPSAQRCAAKGYDTVRHYADLTGQMLSELGINLDFAPVADVNVNPRCPVIGGIERSFSADPAVVRQCCLIWDWQLRIHNVNSCWKHFPGHGSAKGDTHKGLVDVTDTWQPLELDPYRHEGTNSWERKLPLMVMTAHVVNRRLDPSGLPASLSPRITSYLRDSLDFRGVIVTDDLAMGAIVSQYSFEKAVRMAVLAGADMLCLSNNGGSYDINMVPRAVKVIKDMVAAGDITEERILQSAKRIRDCLIF